MAGIWTKHFTVDGKVYYYNSAQNRSLWSAPPDSITHEAPNARPPTYLELSGASSYYGMFTQGSRDDIPPNQNWNIPPESTGGIALPVAGYHQSTGFPNPYPYSVNGQQSADDYSSNSSSSNGTVVSAEDLIAMALSAQQRAQKPPSSSSSQRFRSTSSAASEIQQGHGQGGVGSAVSASSAAYLQQKSELEAREGGRREDGGKWLVR
jgi:hypothetical protein